MQQLLEERKAAAMHLTRVLQDGRLRLQLAAMEGELPVVADGAAEVEARRQTVAAAEEEVRRAVRVRALMHFR